MPPTFLATPMFERLFAPRCPVDDAMRNWICYRFQWLVQRFGVAALQRPPLCPTVEDFPERFDGNYESLAPVVRRIAERLGVDPGRVDLQVYEQDDAHQKLMESGGLEGSWKSNGAAGLYQEDEFLGDAGYRIQLERSSARHPMGAVATLAHELCHALLLGGRHVEHEAKDMEPLTDLATVFFGFGIFTANAHVRETTTRSVGMTGWSIKRLGYLDYPILGFALALYAGLRREIKPAWARHLRPDAAAPFRQAARYLRKHGPG